MYLNETGAMSGVQFLPINPNGTENSGSFGLLIFNHEATMEEYTKATENALYLV